MNKLYDQLLYNWERGFYSVVKDNNGLLWIVSTKMEDLGTGGFRRSLGSNDIEECKASVGSSALTGEQIGTCEEKCGWEIVDVLLPSSLMGKGFQVGDKVEVVADMLQNSGDEGEVISITEVGYSSKKYKVTFLDGAFDMYDAEDLKPVLPVEEKVKDWKSVYISGKGNCTIYDQETHRVLATYKDGKIVN